MPDDPRFIARLKKRDGRAWQQAIDDLIGVTFALIAHLVAGKRQIAEDLNQDVWTQAIDRIDSFDPNRGDLRPWLLQIARNRVALHYRKCRADLPIDECSAETVDDALLPADVAHFVEQSAAIKSSLLCLSNDERAVIEARYWQGQSLADIARRHRRTEKAVEGLLARARTKLKALLAPFDVLLDQRREGDEYAIR